MAENKNNINVEELKESIDKLTSFLMERMNNKNESKCGLDQLQDIELSLDDTNMKMAAKDFYSSIYKDLLKLKTEVDALTEGSLIIKKDVRILSDKYETLEEKLSEGITNLDKNIQEIKNNLPIGFSTWLQKVGDKGNNIIVFFKLILGIIIISWILTTAFPALQKYIPSDTSNNDKIEKLEQNDEELNKKLDKILEKL